MQIENFTPWPHLVFERADTDDRRYAVVTLQGCFSIPDGAPLVALDRQPGVVAADEYRGDPKTTSLLRAGVIATTKPQSDITAEAVARSSQPRAEWPVCLSVGSVASTLVVRGPHQWRHDDEEGWTRTEPTPCTEVPIVYERAFGGAFTIDDELVEEPRNPVGTGFLPDGLDDRAARPAPQIVGMDEPEHEPGTSYAPRGWAPLPAYFAPRRDHIGTADEHWRKTRWPRPPRDFSDAYYQCAHPDLIYPGYLRGDETIRIDGVTHDERPIVTQLPGWCVFLLVRIEGGRMVLHPSRLDHLHLDVSSADRQDHRATLTWRAVLPKAPEIWRVEGRMTPMAAEGAAA